MKKILKQIMLFSMAVLILMTSLAGCSSKVNSSDVVAVFNDKDISLGLANFFARYRQSTYESYLTMYGSEVTDTWKSEVEDGKTYEEMTKETIMDELQEMYILDAEKDNYGVALTEEEKTSIEETAKTFMDSNDKKAIEAMSASEDVIVELLSLMTISNKMKEKIKEDVDKEVSDEEAAQKKMKYVQFAHTDTETEATEDDINKLKTDAEAIAASVKEGQDINTVAEAAGYTVSDYTFDSESTSPNEAVIQAADALAVGEVTDVIEDTDNQQYYVAYLESEFDKEATEQKKTTIIEERKTELYNEKYEELKKEHDWSIKKNVWKKIDFVKSGVTQKQEETETDTTGTDDTTDGSDDTTETEDQETDKEQ